MLSGQSVHRSCNRNFLSIAKLTQSRVPCDFSTRRNPFLVPPGLQAIMEFAGILFDPVAHLTPVLVSSGYQVPVGKVLVFGGSFDSAGSGEFSGISPTIHLAGSVVNGSGSGYLVDASMLVNSGDRAVGLRLPGLRVCPPPFWHPRLPIPTVSREAPRSKITAQSTLSPEIRYWSSCRLETDQPKVNVFGQNVFYSFYFSFHRGLLSKRANLECLEFPVGRVFSWIRNHTLPRFSYPQVIRCLREKCSSPLPEPLPKMAEISESEAIPRSSPLVVPSPFPVPVSVSDT